MESFENTRFGFFGAGAIAEVFARRLIASGVATADHIVAYDIDRAVLDRQTTALGITGAGSNREVAGLAEVVFVAVPPLAALPVLDMVRPALRDDQLVVSLAAGVTLEQMEQAVGRPLPIARVIPNLPSWIGEGMNPYCLGRHVTPAARARVEALLGVFGRAVEVPEAQMTIATALTAVGPTYVFPAIEALADAAVGHGLPREVALAAACRLVAGTAALAASADRSIHELGSMISVHTLDEDAARRVFAAAVDEAHAKIAGVTGKVAAAAAPARG